MTVKDLIEYLQTLSPETKVMMREEEKVSMVDFNTENILQTTDGAYVDDQAPEEEWNHEDGKIVQSGNPIIVLNPMEY